MDRLKRILLPAFSGLGICGGSKKKTKAICRREAGYIRLGCLGYLIAIALLWGGVQHIYTALKNRSPQEVTVEDFAARRITKEWVVLKGARLSLLESALKKRFGRTVEVFIPVRAKSEALGAPVRVLLSTKDSQIISAVEDFNKSGGDMAKELEAAMRHADKLFMEKDVLGLVRWGIDADSKTRDKLAGLDMKLTKDFVILDEGEKPDLFIGIGGLVTGLVACFALWLHASRQQPPGTTIAAPPPLPSGRVTPPPLPPRR